MDLQQFKTPIFEGINDKPVAATSENASNGADLIHKLNGVCDTLTDIFASASGNFEGKTYFISNGVDIQSSEDISESNIFNDLNAFSSFLSQNELSEDLLVVVNGSFDNSTVLDLTNVIANNPIKITIRGVNSEVNIVNVDSINSNFVVNENINIKLSIEDFVFNLSQIANFYKIPNITFIDCFFYGTETYNGSVARFIRIDNLELIRCFFSNTASNSTLTIIAIGTTKLAIIEDCTFDCFRQNHFAVEAEKVYFKNEIAFSKYDIEFDTDLITISLANVFLQNSPLKIRNFKIGQKSGISRDDLKNRDAGCFTFHLSNVQPSSFPLISTPPFNFVVVYAYVTSSASAGSFIFNKGKVPLSVKNNDSTWKQFTGDNLDNHFEHGNALEGLNLETTEQVDFAAIQVTYYRY